MSKPETIPLDVNALRAQLNDLPRFDCEMSYGDCPCPVMDTTKDGEYLRYKDVSELLDAWGAK